MLSADPNDRTFPELAQLNGFSHRVIVRIDELHGVYSLLLRILNVNVNLKPLSYRKWCLNAKHRQSCQTNKLIRMLPHWPRHAPDTAHSQLKHTYRMRGDAYSMCKADDAYWGNAHCHQGGITLMRVGSRPTKCSSMDMEIWFLITSKMEATLPAVK